MLITFNVFETVTIGKQEEERSRVSEEKQRTEKKKQEEEEKRKAREVGLFAS